MPDKMTARYLSGYGFEAKTIIDVGVLAGTPFLYDAFPNARYLLVDPLEESRAAVAKTWSGVIDYEFQVTALGAKQGHLDLEVDPRRLARTSANRRAGSGGVLDRRRVKITTLDSLTTGLKGPFGLKIDTEGHEIDVLKGATETLRQCEFMLAEVSIKKRFRGGYRFSDMIGYMADNGFEALSFLSGLTRNPRFADVLFVPEDSERFDM